MKLKNSLRGEWPYTHIPFQVMGWEAKITFFHNPALATGELWWPSSDPTVCTCTQPTKQNDYHGIMKSHYHIHYYYADFPL